MANTITVNILADVKNMVGGIDDVNRKLDGMSSTAGKVSGMLKGAFGVAAIGAGLGAVGNALGGAVEAARESAKIGALTEQTIKSMGNAANISASQVGDLSGALAMKTGVDDEVIQSGANLVLTFGNIKNAAGEGNNMFDRTVEMANNMSVALGQDMSSSAMQLGKALNDPIKGVGALSRVGVSFTAQQKEQIKTMVESGDVLGAQGVIMDEVGRQFGGAAEAAANPVDKLKVVMGNLQEEVGTALLPVIDKAATYIGKNLPAWIETGKKAIEGLKKVWEDIKPAVTVAFNILKEVGGFIVTHLPQVLAFAAAFKAVQLAMKFDAALKAAGSLGQLLTQTKLVSAATKIWTGIQAAFNLVMMLNPFVLIIAGIALLIGGFILAYKKIEWFRDMVDAVWKWIKDAAVTVWNWLAGFFTGLWQGIVDAAKAVWGGISDFFSGLWDGIKAIFQGFIDFIVNLFMNFTVVGLIIQHWDTIKNATSEAWEWIKGVLQAVWDWIKGVAETVWNGIKDFFVGLWDSIKEIASTVFNGIKDFFVGIWDSISTKVTEAWNAIKEFIAQRIENIKTNFTNIFNAIKDFLGGIWDTIKEKAGAMWDAIKTFISTRIENIKTNFTNIFNAIKDFLAGIWDSVSSKVSEVWEGIKTAVSNAIEKVKEIVGGIKDKILGVFSGAVDWLLSAGKDIVSGLWNGIKNAAGWIKDKILGWAGDLIDGVKSFFGINSPSRVFMGIGDYLVAGLAKGIDKNKDAAKAADSLSKSVVNAFGNPELSVQTGIAAAEVYANEFDKYGSARAGGDNVTINVRFDGLVTDPNAVAKKIEEVRRNWKRNGGALVS